MWIMPSKKSLGWWRIAYFPKRIERWRNDLAPLNGEPRFWIAQGVVTAISIAHIILERAEMLTGKPYEFLPISFYWVPILYVSLTFGLAGALVTSVLAILTSIPNWMVMELVERRWDEIAIVVVAVIISSLLGWQVDRKIEAQKNAQIYAINAVRSQEEERRRLSLDLHDDSIQTLIAVCHTLDTLKDVPSPAYQSLLDVRSSVASTVAKLRTLSIALRPPLLDEMGIVSAIRSLISESAAEAGFTSELNLEGEPRRLPPNIELGIFRIAQEAVRNIVRHAKAVRVRINIAFTAKDINVEIVDDGVGFDTSTLSRRIGENHIGVLTMQEHAEMLHGRLIIDSALGKGTKVKAIIPVPEKLSSAKD